MSAEDKVKLDNLSAGTVAGLTPVDATIVIADGEEGTKTIGVQVSKVEGNTIEIEDDGLYVAKDNTEYAIEKLDDAAEGYSATYRLKKTVDGSSSYVGAEINIPKDLVVQSGSVKTVTEDDQPYVGAKVGDKMCIRDRCRYNAIRNLLYPFKRKLSNSRGGYCSN